MRLSVIIPVLDSHEVLRRQMLHLERIGLPEGTEVIIVDDGSDPPLTYDGPLPVRIIATNDTRPWTWALARNRGARESSGDYLLFFDIDHIITRDILDTAAAGGYDRLQFLREFGVLTEEGKLTQDLDTLISYGFPAERYGQRSFALPPLPNNFAMRRAVFEDIGGYREDRVEMEYPQGEDRLFQKAWAEWERAHDSMSHPYRPTIYMFPNGQYCGDVDADPCDLFHKHTRKTRRNHLWHRQRKGAAIG